MRKITDLQTDLQGTSEAWFIFCNLSPSELLAKNKNIFRQLAPIESATRCIAVVPNVFVSDFDKYLRKDIELAPTIFDNGNALAFAFDCAVKQGLDCALFAQCDSAVTGVVNSYSVLDNQFTNTKNTGTLEMYDVYMQIRGMLNNSCKIAGVFEGKDNGGKYAPLIPYSFFCCDLQGIAEHSAIPKSENNLFRFGLKWHTALSAKGLQSLQHKDLKLVETKYPSDLDWLSCGFAEKAITADMEAETQFVASCKGLIW